MLFILHVMFLRQPDWHNIHYVSLSLIGVCKISNGMFPIFWILTWIQFEVTGSAFHWISKWHHHHHKHFPLVTDWWNLNLRNSNKKENWSYRLAEHDRKTTDTLVHSIFLILPLDIPGSVILIKTNIACNRKITHSSVWNALAFSNQAPYVRSLKKVMLSLSLCQRCFTTSVGHRTLRTYTN